MTRGPSVPRLKGAFLPILVVIALTRASALASFAPPDHLGSHDRLLVFVSVLFSFVLGTLAWPVLLPYAERLRQPRWRHWLVFWGAFALSSGIASALLKHWLLLRLGPGYILSRFWIVPMFAIMACLVFGEMLQAHADRAADRIAQARRLIDRILEAHEHLRGAKGAEGQKLRSFLSSRVERELRAIKHQLAALRTGSGEEAHDLGALRDRLDSLRERDLREASHLLHAHLPKAGLTPALASLARRLGGRLRVTIETTEASTEAVSALPDPVCHAAYCLAEAALERAVEACRAPVATVRLVAEPHGPIRLRIEHGCGGCCGHAADSRCDLAVVRLELAGGAVEETRRGESASLTMTLPFPGLAAAGWTAPGQ